MKLIEHAAHGRIYFINPAQITHIEGSEADSSYIQVYLTETTKDGDSASLTFHGNEATTLFAALRRLS